MCEIVLAERGQSSPRLLPLPLAARICYAVRGRVITRAQGQEHGPIEARNVLLFFCDKLRRQAAHLHLPSQMTSHL